MRFAWRCYMLVITATSILSPQIKERIINVSPILKYDLLFNILAWISNAIAIATTSQRTPNRIIISYKYTLQKYPCLYLFFMMDIIQWRRVFLCEKMQKKQDANLITILILVNVNFRIFGRAPSLRCGSGFPLQSLTLSFSKIGIHSNTITQYVLVHLFNVENLTGFGNLSGLTVLRNTNIGLILKEYWYNTNYSFKIV